MGKKPGAREDWIFSDCTPTALGEVDNIDRCQASPPGDPPEYNPSAFGKACAMKAVCQIRFRKMRADYDSTPAEFVASIGEELCNELRMR